MPSLTKELQATFKRAFEEAQRESETGRPLEAIRKLRRMLTDLQPVEAMETLVAALKKHKSNDDLLAKLA